MGTLVRIWEGIWPGKPSGHTWNEEACFGLFVPCSLVSLLPGTHSRQSPDSLTSKSPAPLALCFYFLQKAQGFAHCVKSRGGSTQGAHPEAPGYSCLRPGPRPHPCPGAGRHLCLARLPVGSGITILELRAKNQKSSEPPSSP